MSINPYVNPLQFSAQAHEVYQQLVDAAIKMYGQDVYYLPAEPLSENPIRGESEQFLFGRAHPIEMQLVTVDGWSGDQDTATQFGLEIKDSATYVVSRKRFGEEIHSFQTKFGQTEEVNHPREGDLIYIPLFEVIFKIVFVEVDKPFRQLGERYTYELKIERYYNNHDTFDTGIPDIDRINKIITDGEYDVQKDPNQDNVAMEIEADGSVIDLFGDKTQKISDVDPETGEETIEDLTRNKGVIDFEEDTPFTAGWENY